MYDLEVRSNVDKIFKKLQKKDIKQLININNKIKEIVIDPYRFKPLKKPLHSMRRVHIGKSFVLLFSINEKKKVVTIENYDHHDKVYKC